MNPQEITRFQHAVLIVKEKKSIAIVACVSAQITPTGITRGSELESGAVTRISFMKFPPGHAARGQPFG